MTGTIVSNIIDEPTFELAEFETPAPTDSIAPIVWSVQKYKVAQMLALHGKSQSKISEETGVPLSTIKVWMKHPEFRDYMKKLIDQAAATMRNDNISLLSRIVAARVEEAEKTGDFASLSKKDTLEIIKELNVLTEDTNKKEESNYMKLLEKLITSSSAPKAIEVPS